MAMLIVFILLIIAVVIFSVQNAAPVAVSFLRWRFDASLALVIFFSASAGLLLGVLIMPLRKLMKPSSRKKDRI